jgi:hydroxymethylpyrimidine pyrophosphatase-like HAD family hydrolase
MTGKIFCVDFDGTCVTDEYPKVGKDVGAVELLQQLVDDGNKIILYTMRHGKELDEAVDWFNENDIDLWGINENPEQYTWSESPKIYAHFYIDDHAVGCPLISDLRKSPTPYVDWTKVTRLLGYDYQEFD